MDSAGTPASFFRRFAPQRLFILQSSCCQALKLSKFTYGQLFPSNSPNPPTFWLPSHFLSWQSQHRGTKSFFFGAPWWAPCYLRMAFWKFGTTWDPSLFILGVESSFESKKISFGGIPNSSNIDILMPHAIFDCMGVFLRSGFAHVDNVIPMIPMIKAITWLLLSRLQGNKPHRNFPEPSEPFLLNLRQHTPEPSEIFQNLPELASGTYTVLHRNSPEPSGTCLGNLHHFTKELSGTFRNPPPEPTPAHSGTLRNLPEPSGTCLGNLHRFTMFYTGTLRNLPEPASGTYTILQRNYPEPSGTCLRNIHQHTPELSGTFRNLPPEPAPATRTGTHRSLSGLKTPLAYAVGEKQKKLGSYVLFHFVELFFNIFWAVDWILFHRFCLVSAGGFHQEWPPLPRPLCPECHRCSSGTCPGKSGDGWKWLKVLRTTVYMHHICRFLQLFDGLQPSIMREGLVVGTCWNHVKHLQPASNKGKASLVLKSCGCATRLEWVTRFTKPTHVTGVFCEA